MDRDSVAWLESKMAEPKSKLPSGPPRSTRAEIDAAIARAKDKPTHDAFLEEKRLAREERRKKRLLEKKPPSPPKPEKIEGDEPSFRELEARAHRKRVLERAKKQRELLEDQRQSQISKSA